MSHAVESGGTAHGQASTTAGNRSHRRRREKADEQGRSVESGTAGESRGPHEGASEREGQPRASQVRAASDPVLHHLQPHRGDADVGHGSAPQARPLDLPPVQPVERCGQKGVLQLLLPRTPALVASHQHLSHIHNLPSEHTQSPAPIPGIFKSLNVAGNGG